MFDRVKKSKEKKMEDNDANYQRLAKGMFPIVFAFRLSGIPLLCFHYGEHISLRVRARWLIHSTFVTILAFFITGSGIAINIYRVFSSRDKSDVAQRICGIVILAGVAIIHLIVMLQRDLLNTFLRQLLKQSVFVPHLKRVVIIAIITSYVLSILICINYVDFGKDFIDVDENSFKSNTSEWADSFLLNPVIIETVEIAIPIFTGLLILPFYFLTIGMFILVCLIINYNFSQLSINKLNDSGYQGIVNCAKSNTTQFVERFQEVGQIKLNSFHDNVNIFFKRHQIICQLVEIADNVFGIMCFVWCATEVIAIVLAVRSMDLTRPSHIRYQMVAFFLCSVICFVSRSVFSARVNNKVLDSLRNVRFMPEQFTEINSFNCISIQSMINSYVLNLSVTAPTITAWGFFSVNKGLILTVGSTIVTYVLVLYQDA